MAKKIRRRDDEEVSSEQEIVKVEPKEPSNAPIPIDTIYNLAPLERFNQIPSYSTKLTHKNYADIVMHYLLMSPPKLNEMVKNVNNLTILEAQIIKGLVKSLGKEDDAFEMKKYFDDRAFGRSKQSVEHSGPNGTPMHMLTGNIQEILDNLTDEELEAIEALANKKMANEKK